MNIVGIGTQEDIIALGLAGIKHLEEVESNSREQILSAMDKFPQADAIIMPENYHQEISDTPEVQRQFIITIPSRQASNEPDQLAALAKEVLGVSINQPGEKSK